MNMELDPGPAMHPAERAAIEAARSETEEREYQERLAEEQRLVSWTEAQPEYFEWMKQQVTEREPKDIRNLAIVAALIVAAMLLMRR